jgi:hypothetical protein
MSAQILETVMYKPKPGVDPEHALERIQAVLDPLLRRGPGLLKFVRSRTEDGTFVDTLLWQDEACFRAKQAAENDLADLGPVFALFDDQSLVLLRGTVFEA